MNPSRELAALTLLIASHTNGQSIQAVRLTGYTPGPVPPIFVTSPAGDFERLFIAEKSGAVRILNLSTGSVIPTPVVQVPVFNSGEGGLLGLAFHPDFGVNKFFYVSYSVGNGRVVARYRMSDAAPNTADPASATIVLFSQAPEGGLHFGGWAAFGPDGKLFVSWGNGGLENNSSDITNNLRGKILRLDVDGPDGIPGTEDDDQFPADPNRNYRVPPDNPFVGVEGDDEIWAFGLRNSWRNSFDRATGEMYVTDVGGSTWEEVNAVAAPPAAPGATTDTPAWKALGAAWDPAQSAPALSRPWCCPSMHMDTLPAAPLPAVTCTAAAPCPGSTAPTSSRTIALRRCGRDDARTMLSSTSLTGPRASGQPASTPASPASARMRAASPTSVP